MPSSSSTKCLLPMIAFLPSYVVEIPCATMYSTSLWSSLWCNPSSSAFFTMAVATLCAKCSSMHAAILNTSSLSYFPHGMTFSRTGWALVKVPVLSNTMVSALAYASKCFPPLTIILLSDASFIAEITEIGVVNLIAHEKSTINTASAFVVFLVSK